MSQIDDKRINEALEILDAAARDKRPELQAAMTDKYSNLNSMIGSITHQLKYRAAEKFEAGRQKAVDAAVGINRNVHNNPWAYVGGAAVGAMLCGYLLGKSHRK